MTFRQFIINCNQKIENNIFTNNVKKLVKKSVLNNYNEYIKCLNDPIYFISNYINLSEVGGNSNFNLYEKQKQLVNILRNDHYVVINKTRQVGASTILQAYIVWLALFFDNIVVGVISKDGPEATEFTKKTRIMIENIETNWLKPIFRKKTERSFELSNGFEIHSSAINPKNPSNTLRGKSITFLVIDEAAHISYIEEAYTGMSPALVKSQKVAMEKNIPYGTCIISTPNGTVNIGEWYYKKVVESKTNPKSLFKYFEMHWKDIAEFANDPNWYRHQCELLENNKRRIAQELDMVFLGSSNSVFSDDTIEILQNQSKEPIIKKLLYNNELWIFEENIDEVEYIIGVDTATLEGKCHSAVVVFRFDTMEQVADFQGDIDVDDFIKTIKYIMDYYKNCFSVIEINSYGYQAVKTLEKDIKYSNKMYKRLEKDKRGKVVGYKYGFQTDSITRPLMLQALLHYVENYPYLIKSNRLILELISLVEKNGRIKGRITDDLVMSAAMVFYSIKYNLTHFANYINLPNEESNEMSLILKDNFYNENILTDINELKNIQDPKEYNKKIMEINKRGRNIYMNEEEKYDLFLNLNDSD